MRTSRFEDIDVRASSRVKDRETGAVCVEELEVAAARGMIRRESP
jgi:hypothetical protein